MTTTVPATGTSSATSSATSSGIASGTIASGTHAATIFYRCIEASGCGLRFPVTPGDPPCLRCPRCGGTIEVVATAAGDEQTTWPHAFSPGRRASHISLMLDNWRSLFNVGAAFRSADGAGARHLYLCGITATPESQRKVAKTALGAERAVAWSYHADAVQLATRLCADGAQLWVLERGTHSMDLFDITNVSFETPVILAAGNEVAGVDPGLAQMADRMVQLPMAGSKESLNVAVALSVAVYWLAAHSK